MPSTIAQAIAVAAGNGMAALVPPLTAMQTSITAGNLAPATLFDALQTFTSWVEIGSVGAPVFQNSWVNFAGGFDTAAYLIDALGIVHLKGTIKTGTIGAAAFTLPAGFRPLLTKVFPIVSNGAFGAVNVFTGGNVTVAVGSNVAASLDGITFHGQA